MTEYEKLALRFQAIIATGIALLLVQKELDTGAMRDQLAAWQQRLIETTDDLANQLQDDH